MTDDSATAHISLATQSEQITDSSFATTMSGIKESIESIFVDPAHRHEIDISMYIIQPLANSDSKKPKFDVAKWCSDLGLGDEGYSDLLIAQGFDYLESILELEEEDLKHVGVTKGEHRKKMMESVQLFPNYHSRDYLSFGNVFLSFFSPDVSNKFIGRYDHMLLNEEPVPGHEFEE